MHLCTYQYRLRHTQIRSWPPRRSDRMWTGGGVSICILHTPRVVWQTWHVKLQFLYYLFCAHNYVEVCKLVVQQMKVDSSNTVTCTYMYSPWFWQPNLMKYCFARSVRIMKSVTSMCFPWFILASSAIGSSAFDRATWEPLPICPLLWTINLQNSSTQ